MNHEINLLPAGSPERIAAMKQLWEKMDIPTLEICVDGITGHAYAVRFEYPNYRTEAEAAEKYLEQRKAQGK